MAYEFRTVLWDRRPSGGLGEQDLTHRFDAVASHLVGNAFDRVVTSDVVWDLKADDDYHIDSFGELHAGWRDTDTLEWDGTRPLYGGYVTEHEGTFEAARHIFTCTISNHNILFDRTEVGAGGVVGTWPTVLGDTPAGYPPGFSIRDWLIGVTSESLPYAGIIPAHFQHFSNGGVDPIFDTIILDESALPAQGDSELFGHFGFMSVRALLDEIVKVARWKGLRDGLDVKPTYFWRLIPTGTTLIPQFCFIDLNNQDSGVASATYALTPTGDERPIDYPYRHRRNAQPVRTRVTVKGEGADPLTGDLNYFSYLKTEGDDLYPTYYQITPGWSAAPINESTLNTIDGCTRYATDIGDAIWGPEGTITMPSFYPAQAGDRVALEIAPDGMSGDVFPVTAVETSLIPHIHQMTLGHRPRDMSDILVPRPDAPMPTTDAGTQGGGVNSSAAGLGRLGANVAGVPRTRPMVNLPVHDDQNVITPRTLDTVGQTWQATTNVAPSMTEDAPTAHNLMQTRDPVKNVRDWWSGVDGTGHPQHYTFPVAAASTVLFVVPDPATFVTGIALAADGSPATSVTVAYQLNAVTVTLPFSAGRFSVLALTFAGTFPTGGVAFLLTEAPEGLLP